MLNVKKFFLLSFIACCSTFFLPVIASEKINISKQVSNDAQALGKLLDLVIDCLYKGDVSVATENFRKAAVCWGRLQDILLAAEKYSDLVSGACSWACLKDILPATEKYSDLVSDACEQISKKFVKKLGANIVKEIEQISSLREQVWLLFSNMNEALSQPSLKINIKQPKTFKELFKEEVKKREERNLVLVQNRIEKYLKEREERVAQLIVFCKKMVAVYLKQKNCSEEVSNQITLPIEEKLSNFQKIINKAYSSCSTGISKEFNDTYKSLIENDISSFISSKIFSKELETKKMQLTVSNLAEVESDLKKLDKLLSEKQFSDLLPKKKLDNVRTKLKLCRECFDVLNPDKLDQSLINLGFKKAQDKEKALDCLSDNYAYLVNIIEGFELKRVIQEKISEKIRALMDPLYVSKVFEALDKKELKNIARTLRSRWQQAWENMSFDKINEYQKKITKYGEALAKLSRKEFADEYEYLKNAQRETQKHLDKVRTIFEKHMYRDKGLSNLLSDEYLLPGYWNQLCEKGSFKDLSEYAQKELADEVYLLEEALKIMDEKLFLKELLSNNCEKMTLAEFVDNKKTIFLDVDELKRSVNEIFAYKATRWTITFLGTLFVWHENPIISNLMLKPTLFVVDFFSPASRYLTLNQALRLFNVIFNMSLVGKEIITILITNISRDPHLVKECIHACLDFFDKHQLFVQINKENPLVDIIKVFANEKILLPLLEKLIMITSKVNKVVDQSQETIKETVLDGNKCSVLVDKINKVPNHLVWIPGMALQYLHDSKVVSLGAWLASFNLPYDIIQKINPEAGSMLKKIVDYGLTPEQALQLIRLAIDWNPLVKALFEILEQKMRQKPEAIKGYFASIVNLIQLLASSSVVGLDSVGKKIKDFENYLEKIERLSKMNAIGFDKRRKIIIAAAKNFPLPKKRQQWVDPELFLFDENEKKWKLHVTNKFSKWAFINDNEKELEGCLKKIGKKVANQVLNYKIDGVDQEIAHEVRDRHFIKHFSEELNKECDQLHEQKDQGLKNNSLDFIKSNFEKKQKEGLEKVRRQKKGLEDSMCWYKYLWLPRLLNYWKEKSALDALEQKWCLNLPDEISVCLKKIQEQRSALHTTHIEWLKSTGGVILNWLKVQFSWDWYVPTQKNEQKEMKPIVQKALSLPWYAYFWIPNIFAAKKDMYLKKKEQKLQARLDHFDEITRTLKEPYLLKEKEYKERFDNKIKGMKRLQDHWKYFAEKCNGAVSLNKNIVLN